MASRNIKWFSKGVGGGILFREKKRYLLIDGQVFIDIDTHNGLYWLIDTNTGIYWLMDTYAGLIDWLTHMQVFIDW